MQVCTMVCGHTFATTSGRPLRPSQTRKNTSRTPRFFRSISTLIQNLAPSPPVPIHSPRTVLVAVHGDPDGGVDGSVGDLAVADLDVDSVDEHRRVHGVERAAGPVVHFRDDFCR